MVDDVGDLAACLFQSVAQSEKRRFVGQVERDMVELDRSGVGDPGGLGERLDRVVGVLEEGDGVLGAHFEEVVAELARDRKISHQTGTQDAVVEADGGVHVVGDQREMVDATPARRLFSPCASVGLTSHRLQAYRQPVRAGPGSQPEGVASSSSGLLGLAPG